MFVSALEIENFKRIVGTKVPLTPITVVVGGNNSGKSCVLQAPHFVVNLLQASLLEGDRIIPAQNLRYLPTSDILDLPHGERLTSDTAPVRVTFEIKDDAEALDSRTYSVGFTRGEGLNVRIDTTIDELAETEISDYSQPFSIYVPGLAGIPLREEFRSDALIAAAIARGDANLYLRNVLLRISRNFEKLERLNGYVEHVLAGAELVVRFDEKSDSYIQAWIRQGERETPLDSMGTGILQFLQIIAYVIEYKPALILLDEPDAHLHPNNQRLIAMLLQEIVHDGSTQVVLATHSRTLLDSFRDVEGATFVWMQNGSVQAEASPEHITMLMALGALDGGERFYAENCSAVFLTEDTRLEYLHVLLSANGIDPRHTLIHSYKTSSRLQAAIELAKFIRSLKPAVRVIVHRDRDFMTDDDIKRLEAMYLKDASDIDLFVPEGCDIEHYFTRPEHIKESFGIDIARANSLIVGALEQNKVEIVVKYGHKLDDLKPLYQQWGKEPPKDKQVMKGKILGREHALGKLLIGKIIEIAQAEIHNPKRRLLEPRDTLQDGNLMAIAAKIPKAAGNEAAYA